MKKIYLLLTVVGLLLPLSQLILWLNEHGVDIALFVGTIVEDRLSLFAWLDVIVSACVLIVFIVHEGRRLSMPRLWLPIAGTLGVGVSFGLPLFLLMREMHRETMHDT